jgi:hypothetical protein
LISAAEIEQLIRYEKLDEGQVNFMLEHIVLEGLPVPFVTK